MARQRQAWKLFPKPEDEETVFNMVLEYSQVEDVPINAAVVALNADIKKKFGCTVTAGWFTRAANKVPERRERWLEVHRMKAMLMSEEQDKLERELLAQLGKNETINCVDMKGKPRKKQQRKLKHIDIAAFQAVDLSRRRRIAQMQPKLYRQAPEAAGGSSGTLNFNFDISGKSEDDNGE